MLCLVHNILCKNYDSIQYIAIMSMACQEIFLAGKW